MNPAGVAFKDCPFPVRWPGYCRGPVRWGGYHARSRERGPRPLLLRACDFLGAGGGRMAVDLGCGSGTDVIALLQRGWAVTAVDQDEAGLRLLRAGGPGCWLSWTGAPRGDGDGPHAVPGVYRGNLPAGAPVCTSSAYCGRRL